MTTKNDSNNLDMLGRHRTSILFAGTTLMHCSAPITLMALEQVPTPLDALLRALQRTQVRDVSKRNAMGFVSWHPWEWQHASAARGSAVQQMQNCRSHIILTSMPSDSPIAHSCAMRLKREADVVCQNHLEEKHNRQLEGFPLQSSLSSH
jgi:hypothetical protein